MNIFIVTAGWDYEGMCGLWAFTDEAQARMQFELYAAKLRDGDKDTKGDYVTLKGPYTLGENMSDYDREKAMAQGTACGAAYQARLTAAKEKRKAKKAAAA